MADWGGVATVVCWAVLMQESKLNACVIYSNWRCPEPLVDLRQQRVEFRPPLEG